MLFVMPFAQATELTLPKKLQSETRVFGDIPGDQGMAYFYDVWDNYRGGGPMTVTDDLIAHYESDDVMPYRVLFTGKNYVLFAYRRTYEDGEQWTSFGVFTLLPLRYRDEWEEEGLRFMSCSIGWETSVPWFELPVEELLALFHKHCHGGVHPETGNLFARAPGGYIWSDAPYWRAMPAERWSPDSANE